MLLFFLSGCGGKTGGLPLEGLKKELKDTPTYSIILEDMKQEGTFFKTYFHRYLVVLPERSTKTQWFEVPEKYYKKTSAMLGMSLLTRKEGVFDDVPSPPGYAYVGDENYGRWREDDRGGSFWEFYGKYAFFSSLFGGWYHPIYRNDYRDYQRYHTGRRPYFGSKNQYGSSGTIVKKTRPGFYARRMSAVKAGKSSFVDKVNQKIGRTRTGLRSRSGGVGK